ncbi:hypothetical protein EX895_002446 [Sporisorium graminicola]|uniref:Xylanolytic transcriptional activator regulatory domain-containing protein n=1 Tax=Sporisorium graminicola TaxID=280036 RepID=A0A4U7KYF7_9BASI|nr:hypothetical protein EX895_002446 [Sporisorium graminicola]TKY88458.1 hypothetical protein EX895_002446 [Sporisorium graminicola]
MVASESNEIESRVARIEQLLQAYLPGMLPRSESPSPPDRSTSSRTYRSSTSRARSRSLERGDLRGRLSPETGLYNGGPTSHITSILNRLPGDPPATTRANLPIRSTEASSDIDEVMSKFGQPWPTSSELLSALISREHCEVLLGHYFDAIDWIYQPMPHVRVPRGLKRFWDAEPQISVQSINIFAALCCVCAIATLSVQHALFPEQQAERLQIARRFHYAGRQALSMSSLIGREDLDQILAWVLSCHFLILDRHLGEAVAEGASLVRAAFSLGLHRDGTKLGLAAVEVEFRRRAWAAVYCLDRAMAIGTLRPSLVDERFCDTQPVNDLAAADEPLPRDAQAEPDDLAHPPTTYTLTLYRCELARLEGEVSTMLQTLGSPVTVDCVLAMDRRIVHFQNSLPSYFQAQFTQHGLQYDKSLDPRKEFLPTHRYLIHTSIDGLRVALLRPYLLRATEVSEASDTRFASCRAKCVEAALHHAEILRDSLRELRASTASTALLQAWRVHIGTQRWFQSLLICGLGLVMDPDGPDAARLKSHLEYYLEVYYSGWFVAKDEMCEREAVILKLFLSRLEQAEGNGRCMKGADAPPGEAERASDFATLNGGETRLETFSGILGNADSSSLPNAEIDPAYWQNLIDKILG